MRGGRVAYSGSRMGMASFFDSVGHPIPELANPSEHALDIASIDLRNELAEAETRSRVDKIVEQWDKQVLPEMDLSATQSMELYFENRKKQLGLFHVLPILTLRSFTNIRRQPGLMIARVMQTLSLGLILTMFYARFKSDQTYVQARVGALVRCIKFNHFSNKSHRSCLLAC